MIKTQNFIGSTADHPAAHSGEDLIKLYFDEIGLIDLLNRDREFWLAARLKARGRIRQLESKAIRKLRHLIVRQYRDIQDFHR